MPDSLTKLCCRKEWRSPTHLHIPLLYPFWGCPKTEIENNNPANHRRFDKFVSDASSYLSITESEDQDLWLFPTTLDYLSVPEVAACFELYSKQLETKNKTGIAFCNGDLPLHLNHRSINVFHTSVYREFNFSNIRAGIPFTSDPFLEIDKLDHRFPSKESPIISFRGVAPPLSTESLAKQVKEQFRYALYRSGALKKMPEKWAYGPRVRAIKELSKSNTLDFQSQILPSTPVNWSCGYFREADSAKQSFRKQRQDYLKAILQSHYVLCARGQGNYSLRFYETLGLGRIPIYIDSGGALPFEELIDWTQHAIIIDHRDIPNIEATINAHFEQHSASDLKKIGDSNRELYLRYCTPEGFFRSLFRERLVQF
ncbi:MAG: glycosyltransferase family 47 protein [Opitutales bacterium]|nr:glycosyltransferase family 47 protein [Opitutales bacterium]